MKNEGENLYTIFENCEMAYLLTSFLLKRIGRISFIYKVRVDGVGMCISPKTGKCVDFGGLGNCE